MNVTSHMLAEFKNQRRLFVGGSVYDQMETIWAVLAGMEVLLIGDSLANIKLAYPKTSDVSMNVMIMFAGAVLRGAEMVKRVHPDISLPLFVFDVPFCQMSSPELVLDACRQAFSIEAGPHARIGAVKIEIHKADPDWQEKVGALKRERIPFIVHIGYTPQAEKQVDKNIVQGKTVEGALYLAKIMKEVQSCGAFAVFIEAIPWQVAQILTQYSTLPVIGLGAGPHTDCIWIMISDVLGITQSYFALEGRKNPVFSPITFHKQGLQKALSEMVQKARSRQYPVVGHHTYNLRPEKSEEIIDAVSCFLGIPR